MGRVEDRQETGKQTYVTELPEYARPYYENLMEPFEAESLKQYTPFEGQQNSAVWRCQRYS